MHYGSSNISLVAKVCKETDVEQFAAILRKLLAQEIRKLFCIIKLDHVNDCCFRVSGISQSFCWLCQLWSMPPRLRV